MALSVRSNCYFCAGSARPQLLLNDGLIFIAEKQVIFIFLGNKFVMLWTMNCQLKTIIVSFMTQYSKAADTLKIAHTLNR
jgi:hypothetical protein